MADDMDDIYEGATLEILDNIGLKPGVLADDVKAELKKYVEEYMVPLGEAKKSIARKHGTFQEGDKLIPPDCEEGYEVLVGKKRECSHEQESRDLKYRLGRTTERMENAQERYEKLAKDRYPIIEGYPPLRMKWLRPDFEQFIRENFPDGASTTIADLFERYNSRNSDDMEPREFQYCLFESEREGWIRLFRYPHLEEHETDIHHSMLGRLNAARAWWFEFPEEEKDDDSDSD